ncbi:MAG: NAD(P)H-hydrate dehydratase [Clostridia bacterium]|nr:NAD(P)H-hydrate dehydratase [Clostridia bacterium]
MQEIDRAAAEKYAMQSIALMENAGAAVARVVLRVAAEARPGGSECRFPKQGRGSGRLFVSVFSGRGNNGGDGFVAARHLIASGADVAIYVVGELDGISGDARTNLDILTRMDANVVALSDEASWSAAEASLARSRVVVDAILGTGARGGLSDVVLRAIGLIRDSGVPAVAVDVPTGVDALTGEIRYGCVTAHTTVTFGLPKIGLVTFPGASHVGRILVDRIGLPGPLLGESEAAVSLTTPEDVSSALPRRTPYAHKGDCGRVLVVAGSRGMPGAGVLAALSALRAGAGIAYLAAPDEVTSRACAYAPEVVLRPMPGTSAGGISSSAIDMILDECGKCQAVVAGPGLTVSDDIAAVLNALVERCPVPLVIDADGINVLAGKADVVAHSASPVVLTPHPGELGRLLGASADEINRHRLERARAAAEASGAVVALKGARTVIARSDGRVYVNPTGNPGMATAGSGDVLAGVIGSLIAQGSTPFLAGICGTYVHGLAGDIARRQAGQHGMIAGDILGRLPQALSQAADAPAELWSMMPVACIDSEGGDSGC